MTRLPRRGSLTLLGRTLRWEVSRATTAAPVRAPGPCKLHLGPGAHWTKPGPEWLTVDADVRQADIALDFGRFTGFPLPDGSVTHLYGSHVFEHISIWKSDLVLRECHRVLAPGGVMRCVLPDARRSIEAYMNGEEYFPLFQRRRERALREHGVAYTPFDCLLEDFVSRSGQTGLLGENALAHQNAWDFESFTAALARAGFPPDGITRSGFRLSACDAFAFEGTYPSEANEDYRSLYVEARKGEE